MGQWSRKLEMEVSVVRNYSVKKNFFKEKENEWIEG